jgi:hypothetical protein
MAKTDLVRSGARKAAKVTRLGASRAQRAVHARRLRRQIAHEEARIGQAVVVRIETDEQLRAQLPEIRASVSRIRILADELASQDRSEAPAVGDSSPPR